MRIAFGISLLVFGGISLIVGNFQHLLAETELLEKRPDLQGLVYGRTFLGRAHPDKVHNLYKAEFPKGRRLVYYWTLMAIGFASFFAGVLLLVRVA